MTFSLASIQTSPRRRYARPVIYKGKFAERARDMCRAGAAADALTASSSRTGMKIRRGRFGLQRRFSRRPKPRLPIAASRC